MAVPTSKGRMIRKDISRSEKFATLSKESMVLFTMLIPHFSSHGKMNGSPHYIKGEVVPLITWLTLPVIDKCLKEISDKTSVKWFQYKGLYYLHSVNWKEHQELRMDRLGADDLPDYSGTTPGQVPPEVEVKEEVEDKEEVPYGDIIDYLNQETSKSYRVGESHKKFIRARWNEGYRLDDFKTVIDNKVADWLSDEKMSKYLAPDTLFGTKFDKYLNQETETVLPLYARYGNIR